MVTVAKLFFDHILKKTMQSLQAVGYQILPHRPPVHIGQPPPAHAASFNYIAL